MSEREQNTPEPNDELAFLGTLFGRAGRVGASLIRQGMSKMRLGDPTDYMLMLVSSAVAGEATFVEVFHDLHDLVLEHDGQALSGRQLQDLYSSLQGSMENAQVRKLALGLNAAFATEVDQVVVESWDGHSGSRLTLTAGDQKLDALRTNPSGNHKVSTRIRLMERGKLRKVTKFVTRFSGVGAFPEMQAVTARCLYAGPTVRVNRAPINQPADMGPVLMWRALRPTNPVPTLAMEAQRPRRGLCSEKASSGPFYAVLALGSRSGGLDGANFVAGGVHLTSEDSLGFSTAAVIASAAGLESDLRHTQIVINPAYNNLLAILRQELLLMALDLLNSIDEVGPTEEVEAAIILEDLAGHLRERKEWMSLEKALRTIVELRERGQGSGSQELVDSRLRLVAFLESQNRQQEATAQYERLIPTLQSQAQNHLNKYRIEEAVALYYKALDLREQMSGQDHAQLAQEYYDLGEICRDHRHPAAEDLLRKSLTIRERIETEPLTMARTLYGLADLYRVRKCHVEAEQVARRALTLLEADRGSEHPELVPYLKLMGDIFKACGRYAEATDFESRAMLLKYRRA